MNDQLTDCKGKIKIKISYCELHFKRHIVDKQEDFLKKQSHIKS